MKIDRNRLKKSTSEVPSECQNLIDKLKACSKNELCTELSKVETWTFGKCELYHWIEILNKFDSILEEAVFCPPNDRFFISCDISFNTNDQKLLLLVLHFTTLLIEHSFSRHLYNSMEHLITLLSSSNMQIVLGVLNLLYMFSKRSNFITRLNSDQRQALLCRLNFLAETWGGNDYGFGLADCCKEDQEVPQTASTLYYEYFGQDGNWSLIHIKDIHLEVPRKSVAEHMSRIIEERKDLSEEKILHVFTRLRLAASFHDYSARLQFVQARLQALSVLVYANALQESAHTLLYPGLLDELVELLELQQPHLVEIRAAALRTLTSIIHLDRNPHLPKKPGSRLNLIIGVTGAASYHGFLPVLVRTCIRTLTQPKQEETDNLFPLPLATALFSFLYHLASYECGGEALVACGMMESLLRVINWPGNELEHITFVTRAVRVIDLITNIDMQAFHTHSGISSFISRLNMEVNLCRKEQPYEIIIQPEQLSLDEIGEGEPAPSTSRDRTVLPTAADYKNLKTGLTCLPQRAALLKSMLNFLKKAIQDSAFSDSIRHVMEGTLPSSLKHIISNAEYYGPSLFLLATDVVTVYVFQEPSHLSSLQDNGLTEVLLHALLIKDVPATREVIGSLPNVFSALCLNARGLMSFVKYKPFEKLFKVLLSPVYLAAMRRRRNSHPMSDTASNLGNAMDELIRHQPSLKIDATDAIIRLLEDLVHLGTDPKYVCWRAQSKSDVCVSPPPTARSSGNNEAGSSDEDDDDEEEASTSSHTQRDETHQDNTSQTLNEKTPIALVDYILNVMKFVDAILSNNSTDDHCRAFVHQGGLKPLLAIVGLPNLPIDSPITQAAQAVASVCKSVLNLGHEPQVLQIGLEHLYDLVQTLEPLYNHLTAPGGSVLLKELATAPNIDTAFSTASATPLLHAMGAAHGYIVMFVHVCRTGRAEIRTMALQKWGQDNEYGRKLLHNLVKLYTALVWESTLLLALCSDDIIPAGCDFGREDLDKLLPQDLRNESDTPWSSMINQDTGSNGMTSAMEALSTNPSPVNMDVDSNQSLALSERTNEQRANAQQLKYVRTLLGASSRLGRALAELFGLLVKLCVGSPIRQRRGQNIHPTPNLTIPASRDIARVLSYILVEGLAWKKLPITPVPKFRLTFLICSVGFTSPMLFDEKRYAYHIMLQMFVEEGGQTAFFDTFRWALSAGGTIPLHKGLEHPDLPEGTAEFLDAWLLLLEKMVNPKSILDTPHVIPARARRKGEEFDAIRYLNQIHKQAFNTIMMMWGKKPLKTYGGRMSETMLSIIRHILRGEQIIAERTVIASEDENPPSTSASTDAPRTSTTSTFLQNTEVDADHLKQLMDMGFSKEHSTEALLHTTSLEQATDYLLNNPPSSRGSNSMDLDLTEDYQMLRAIAMSLGDKPSTDSKEQDKGDNKKPVDDAPLTEDVINHFTKGALAACLNLLDTLPDTVYRVCVLLVTITKRNGVKWRDDMLSTLVSEISCNVQQLLAITEENKPPSEIVCDLIHSDSSSKAAVRIYLFTLLFEGAKIKDMRIPNTEVVQCARIVPSLVNLLIQAEKCMTAAGNIHVIPKWIPPLLLLLNLIEKVALIAQRQEEMEDLTAPLWKSYDIVGGKWVPFTAANNKIINEAYHNGEDECRINSGGQRYLISFRDFHQSEIEIGNNVRSIIRTPKSMCKEATKSREAGDIKTGTPDSKLRDNSLDEYMFRRRRKPNREYEKLHQTDSGKIVASCVRLMMLPVDRDTLHALMRICLRYTRDHENATIFAKEGGVKILLETTQGSSYTGFINLATLLIRHIIEEPRTLWTAMENVVSICTMSNVPPQFRDLFYLSTRLSSAISRNPEIYLQMAQNILRVDVNALNRRNPLIEDNRLLLKSIPSTADPRPPLAEDSVAIKVICDLLDALVKPTSSDSNQTTAPTSSVSSISPERPSTSSSSSNINTASARSPVSMNLPLINQPVRLRRTPGHIDILRSASHDASRPENNEDDMPITPILPLKSYRDTTYPNGKVAEEEARKPLLPKSVILKILAEAVRSYEIVATLITDYEYQAGQSELITENTNALAYILDNLLPVIDRPVEIECCTTVRMLVAALAASHIVSAQLAVVHEVKQALLRALAMPESLEKHNQIQLLTALIPIMIENCPTENPSNIKNPYKRNDIFLLMLRKGLICDLARVPQCLDLSSPNMVATINATLKPLETLLRISNQPVHNSKFKFKVPRKVTEEQGNTNSANTSTTQAQVEEVSAEDSESNDQELTENTEGLEQSSNIHSGDVHTGLEEIMDQLLERDLDRSGYRQQVSENHNMEIADEQPIENIVYNPDRDATEDMMSSESGDSNEDSNGSEPEDREMDEDAEENEDDAETENDPYDYDDPFEFYDDEVVQSLFRMRPIERENENVLMIQYPDPDHEGENENSRRNVSSVQWSNGLSFPFGLLDDSANVPDAVLPPPHPLLMARHNMDAANVSVSRTQRTNRQRRYHYLQIPNNTRDQNPPVILQRLLGPDSQNLPRVLSTGGLRENRLLVVDNGFGVFTNSREEEAIDFVDQSVDLLGPSLSISMHTNPTALNWWNQEAALLDGDSGVNLMLIMCSNLVGDLEKHRWTELAKVRAKRRRKMIEEEDKPKSKDQDDTVKETNKPMETEGENTTLSQETQDNITASARALANWALENTSEDDILNPSQHVPLGFSPDLFSDSDFVDSEEFSRDNAGLPREEGDAVRRSEYINSLLVPSVPVSRSNIPVRIPTSVNQPAPPTTSTTTPLTNSSSQSNFMNSAVPDSLDFIIGITGSPSRQGDAPGNLISVASNNWALLDEGAGPSRSRGNTTESSAPTPATPPVGPGGDASNTNSGTTDIPDWVDPSFLAALPDEMRAEVLAEQMRLQRIRVRSQTMTADTSPVGMAEVNPEFLAALPPAIQEEVLAQQRIEQQRQAAATANPNDPVDAAAFFQNLQPSLRQAILTDMEESQISVLPPELAAEAQNLRRDWESRNRQLMQERFLNQIGHSNNTLSSILRSRGIMGNQMSNPHERQGTTWLAWNRPDGSNSHSSAAISANMNIERTGRPLLDHESLTCLLVLLFIDEPKFNTLRLHRVIRNLCSHVPTREWVIKSLLSIIEKSNESNDPFPVRSINSVERPQWLNISLDAALGCRANVFLMKKIITRRHKSSSPIAIHPQAASVVCKHTLELLISLAKSFPVYFLPTQAKPSSKVKVSNKDQTTQESSSKPSNDFWDILIRLDSTSSSRKGKGVLRLPKDFTETINNNKTFEDSPFGQLISMLSFNVIKRSSQLTDKLLRLLSLISSDLPVTHSSSCNEENADESPSFVPDSEEHLQLAIQVLTSKSCSEDGLEDATALLLNLSHYSANTRRLILRLLLEGAIDLSVMVQTHISNLVKELKTMNNVKKDVNKDDHASDNVKTSKGILKDRFTNDAVIVAASSKTKATCDLQLPSMAPLISKTSSQAFFLRILKVIVQIKEVEESKALPKNLGSSVPTDTTENAPMATVEIEDNVSTELTATTVQNIPSESANAMDTSGVDTIETNKKEPEQEETQLLSEALNLGSLWNTLSQCLFELEETPDHHAVLVLQPAVEAFFLVHSASQNKKSRDQPTSITSNNARDNAESGGILNTANRTSGSMSPSPPADNNDVAPLSPLDGASSESASSSVMQIVDNKPAMNSLNSDQKKFLAFAETHRTVLNQILRQTTTHLADGPFSVLVDHTRVLDFDVKRRYFRTELERLDEGVRREELAVHVRRSHIFEDSFRELYRRNSEEWKNRFYIVFEDEEGQDAGGLLREWYVIISRDIFNPMYALFTVSPGDRVTYMINSSSHCNPNHLCYYKFVGRVIAKAIYDNKLLECYFTRSFYKHILGIQVKHTDMESEDYSFYQGLVYLTEHNVSDLGYDLTFSAEVQEFGVTDVRDLIPNGRNIAVTEDNKHEYIRRVCQMKMCGAIRQQLNAFLEGFYDIIPKRLISIFNEQELELLISGLPNVDIEDLKANTEYHKYQTTSIQIQWFWRSLRSFDQADRAKFLQFVTGTSKVPLQGFAALEGMNGVQKFQIHRDDRSTDRLPSAHTCFNQLDLPVYETYDKLRSYLLKAVHECSEGFGFA